MLAVVFVHGTGVREAAYQSSLAKIDAQLQDRFGIRATPCYWGGKHGADLQLHGDSIPTYQATRQHRGIGEAQEEDEAVLLWTMLYADPLYELAMLRSDNVAERFVPGKRTPLESLAARVASISAAGDIGALLERVGTAQDFDEARTTVAESAAYQRAVATPGTDVVELRGAVARATVAHMIAFASDRLGDDAAPPTLITSAELRDELVDAIDAELAGGRTERGIGKLIGPPLAHIASHMASPYLRRKRGAISDAAYPAAGDVVLYQVRGDSIRTFIADTIDAVRAEHGADTSVVLLAHSLGGIASVDLLASDPNAASAVPLLVTVGSQAPFLYEIGALWSMPFEPPQALRSRLPDHFPNWLNAYDQRDLLSYVAANVFRRPVVDPGSTAERRWVEDVLVDNGQPFPASHSAYWDNNHFWDEFSAKIGHVAGR
jgi:hypothetical protein